MATTSQPIGITLPVRHGESGYFNQSFNVLDQIKSNIHMLLRTKKGERRMNPNFGSGLWNILFEFNDANLPMMVENTVKKDIERWLPYLTITKVTVKNGTDEKNKYAVGVSVSFIANSAGISTPQTVEVLMQQGNL
jgi:phage baseplate assembly protein W